MTEQTLLTDLIPLSKFNEKYDYPTTKALRMLMFHNYYGFSEKCTRKIGKRIYVHIPSFQEWITETNGRNVR